MSGGDKHMVYNSDRLVWNYVDIIQQILLHTILLTTLSYIQRLIHLLIF